MSRSPHRFSCPELAPAAGALVTLSPEESHHLLRVLRLGPGAEVEIFGGDGRAWRGAVEAIEGDRAQVRLREPVAEPGQGPVVNLAVAALKHRAIDLLIEKASELGVARLQPLLAARCVAQPDEREGAVPARWSRLALAAAKQCGRNAPLEIRTALPLAAWLKEMAGSGGAYADGAEGAAPIGEWLATRDADTEATWIAIGPEGGWTPEERRKFEEVGFAAVALGPLTLRAETAAIAAAAVCRLLTHTGQP